MRRPPGPFSTLSGAQLSSRSDPLRARAVRRGLERQGELQGLRWKGVDFVTNTLRIRRDKTSDGGWVTLNSPAREALLTLNQVLSLKCSLRPKVGPCEISSVSGGPPYGPPGVPTSAFNSAAATGTDGADTLLEMRGNQLLTNGGGGRTRTSDTGLMRPLLCHLSYAAASVTEQKIYRLAGDESSERRSSESSPGRGFEPVSDRG